MLGGLLNLLDGMTEGFFHSVMLQMIGERIAEILTYLTM